MQNTTSKTNKMVKIAMIAAIYATLTLVLAPISYGVVQFRISELLTVLPAFTTLAIPGLSLGCCLANLIGALLGLNPTGYIDAIVGTSATLIAAILSYLLAKTNHRTLRLILVPLPPVLVNAVIVGAELTVLFNAGEAFAAAWIANAVSVAIGQAVVCYLLGIPLMMVLSKNEFYKKLFRISQS